MLVLALDTSTPAVTAGVVELGEDLRVIAERVTINPRGHGELLAPNVAACLIDASGLGEDIGAVVVGNGPGPFTGLRVGLVTAAVFAELRGVPAYAVCSLDAIADAARDEPALLVATDARRREVYWARYERGVRVAGPAVDAAVDVPTEGLTAVAGQGAELYDFGAPLRAERFPTPLALVRRADGRIRAGEPSDPLTPLYLRRPDAVPSATTKTVLQ